MKYDTADDRLIRVGDASHLIRQYFRKNYVVDGEWYAGEIIRELEDLPSAEAEYEPVTVEDFAKTMSENTPYSFMAWYGETLELMKEQGFVICKKTMGFTDRRAIDAD